MYDCKVLVSNHASLVRPVRIGIFSQVDSSQSAGRFIGVGDWKASLLRSRRFVIVRRLSSLFRQRSCPLLAIIVLLRSTNEFRDLLSIHVPVARSCNLEPELEGSLSAERMAVAQTAVLEHKGSSGIGWKALEFEKRLDSLLGGKRQPQWTR